MKASLKKISYFLIFAIALFSCGQKKETRQEVEIENKELPTEIRAQKALYDEVIAVHDEAMTKMETMMYLKGQLQEKIDLARENEEANISEFESRVEALEMADEAMMQWMRNFEAKDNDSMAHEAIMSYYKEQKEHISEVEQRMNEAIARAREVTGNN